MLTMTNQTQKPIHVPEPIKQIEPLNFDPLTPEGVASKLISHLLNYPGHLISLRDYTYTEGTGRYGEQVVHYPDADTIARFPRNTNDTLTHRAYKLRQAIQLHETAAYLLAALGLPNEQDTADAAEARGLYEKCRTLSGQCVEQNQREIADAHEAITQRRKEAAAKAQATRKQNALDKLIRDQWMPKNWAKLDALFEAQKEGTK